jgi:autotransporter family porin
MARYDALKAGKWDDPTIWFDALQNPPTPAGPPAAGDTAVVDALSIGSGSQITGTASVATLMISNSNTAAAALTFNGSFTVSSDIDLTSTPSPTPAPLTVTLIGAFAAGHQLEIGTNTTLAASSATITGPSSGTIGIQDFGSIVLKGGTLTSNLAHIVGTLDVENGRANVGTLQVGAPVGNTASLTIAGGAGVVDTFGTIGTTGAGLGLATVSGHWNNQQLTVGHAGTADVVADNGAMITAQGGGLAAGQQALVIGELSSARGTLEVSSASVQVTGDVGIGVNGKGTLVVNTGGQVTATGSLDTGTQSVGAGVLDINGGTLTVNGMAILGDVASGQMTVAASGSVSIGTTLTLGAQTVGTGNLTLIGAGAQLQTGALVVGSAGVGTATLGDQTDLTTSSDVIVGATQGLSGSKGTLTLMSGSDLSDGGNLIVGDAGTSTRWRSTVARSACSAPRSSWAVRQMATATFPSGPARSPSSAR